MTGQTDNGARRLRHPELLLYLFAAVALLVLLGYEGLRGSEDRWAEIVREMQLNGDYWHPALNGRVYFDKPLLSYWLIAAAAFIFRQLNEFIIRLPSALLALAGLAATVYVARKLFNRQVALTAGWLMAGSYGFLWFGRLAEADMGNMAVIMLALAWFVRYRYRGGFWVYLVFFLICALGAHLKGLPALIVPPVLAVPLLWENKLYLNHLKISLLAAAVIAGGVFYGIYYLSSVFPMPEFYQLPSHGLDGWGLFIRENFQRATAAFDHKDEPFFSYAYNLPRLLLPWSVFTTIGLGWMIYRWKSLGWNGRGMLIGFALVFALFSASESRRWYYILPLLPYSMIFGGYFLADAVSDAYRWKRYLIEAFRYLAIFAGSLAVISVIVIPFWSKLVGFHLPLLFLVALPVLGALTLLVMAVDERRSRTWLEALTGMPRNYAGMVLGVTILAAGGFSVLKASFDDLRTLRPFARELKANWPAAVEPEDTIFFSVEANASLNYYVAFSAPIAVAVDEKERVSGVKLAEFFTARAGRPTVLIAYSKYLPELEAALPALPIKIDVKRPDYQEKRLSFENAKSRKMLVWILNARGVSATLANDNNSTTTQRGTEQ